MEISSVSNLYPQEPNRRSEKALEGKNRQSFVGKESFEGPKTGELLTLLKDNHYTRESLINKVKQEIEQGNYFTEDKIKEVVEKLTSSL